MTSTPSSWALTAPETISEGALSPPIASTATRGLLKLEDVPALVGSAVGTDAVRQLRLVTLRARRIGNRRHPAPMGAPFVAACAGLASLGALHVEQPDYLTRPAGPYGP